MFFVVVVRFILMTKLGSKIKDNFSCYKNIITLYIPTPHPTTTDIYLALKVTKKHFKTRFEQKFVKQKTKCSL